MNKREGQISEYFPLTKTIVNNMCFVRGIKDKMLIEDCQSIAVIDGLIKAVDIYDDSKGTSLKTWVTKKVHFAVLDYLRKINGNFRREKTEEIKEHRTKPGWAQTRMFSRILCHNFVSPTDLDSLSNTLELSINGTEKKVCDKDLTYKLFKFIDVTVEKQTYKRARKDISDIFHLYFIEGYIGEEIAEMKNLTEARIHQIINYKWIPRIQKHFANIN